jgi:DNA-binding response OmpR family regulator
MSYLRVDHVASRLLIIDHDPLMLTAIGSVLDTQGHRCVLARNESMALESIAEGLFDVIILSIDQLQVGCDFAARLRGPEIHRDVPIIFLVPELSSTWMTKLSSQGGVFCLLKPIDPYALIDLVDQALWMPHVARGHASLPPAHWAQQSDWVKLVD